MQVFTSALLTFIYVSIEPVTPRIEKRGNETLDQQVARPLTGQPFGNCDEAKIIIDGNIRYKCTRNGVQALCKTCHSEPCASPQLLEGICADLIACIGSSRTAYAELKINDTFYIDDMRFSCDEKDGRVIYTEERQNRCLIGDKAVPKNETTVIGNLVFFCSPNGIEITGCLFSNNSEVLRIKVGESVQIGSVRHFCSGFHKSGTGIPDINNRSGSQSGTPEAATTPSLSAVSPRPSSLSKVANANGLLTRFAGAPCTDDAGQHKNNETWKVRNFRRICRNGVIKVLACVIDGTTELRVGQSLEKSGLLHRCVDGGNKVVHESVICGTGKVVCNSPAAARNGSPRPSNGGAKTVSDDGSKNRGRNIVGNCVSAERRFRAGDTWVSNNFKSFCHNNGSISIYACITDSKQEFGLGESLVLDGLRHICLQTPDGGASYSFQTCDEIQCEPEGSRRRLQTP